jgi:hypothetical protein
VKLILQALYKELQDLIRHSWYGLSLSDDDQLTVQTWQECEYHVCLSQNRSLVAGSDLSALKRCTSFPIEETIRGLQHDHGW